MDVSRDHQLVGPISDRQPSGLFVMDFDGTLLRSDRTFADIDLDALNQLGARDIIRTIATGRSLYSFNTVALSGLPVDFVIFSTGAGVLHYASGKIVRKVSLEPAEVKQGLEVLKANRLDFMVHHLIPDNHMFSYYRSNKANADFERRIEIYSQFATPLSADPDGFGSATQLLAVVPPRDPQPVLEKIRKQLTGFNVIQTTSPLDGKSTWIEIFPITVSKSQTAAWLAEGLGINKQRIVSVGNDYNDLDLLEWTTSGYVVDNAPADLKSRFAAVASNDNGGVAEAARRSLEGTFNNG